MSTLRVIIPVHRRTLFLYDDFSARLLPSTREYSCFFFHSSRMRSFAPVDLADREAFTRSFTPPRRGNMARSRYTGVHCTLLRYVCNTRVRRTYVLVYSTRNVGRGGIIKNRYFAFFPPVVGFQVDRPRTENAPTDPRSIFKTRRWRQITGTVIQLLRARKSVPILSSRDGQPCTEVRASGHRRQ